MGRYVGSLVNGLGQFLIMRHSAAFRKAAAVRAEEIRTGRKSTFKGSVANLSLGGGKAPTLDAAINAAVRGGLSVAVAAGNDNKDACNYSPAASEEALTVGASTLQDSRAYFSNIGECVDVFAPGLNILSTWNTNDHATNIISGTSMASPRMFFFLCAKFHPYIVCSFRCCWASCIPSVYLPRPKLQSGDEG